MTIKLEGSMTALATPFRNGELDEPAYQWLVDYQVTNGTSVLVPMGTTGEAATMSTEEKSRAVAACIKFNKGRAKVIAGAGSSSTSETIASVKRVRELGADGALIVTPFYNKPTQAGLVEHYRAIAQAHPGFPIVAYNVPGRTGADLLPETALRLCELPEVVALKEATGSILRTLELYEKCGERLALLSGEDSIVAPFLACGGKGVISVSSNVVPRQMADLVAAGLQGDFKRARELQLALQPLHRMLFIESNPIPVKRALNLMGKFGPELRLPLVQMTDANAARLKEELQKLKLV
jgi:4-hydroxy-tetrahydrodipicolinate synthase